MFQSTDHDTCVWRSIILVMAFTTICFGETLNVTCPKTRLSWEERAENFTCTKGPSYLYHCILDDKENLLEICIPRISVPQGTEGCPQVTSLNGVYYHSDAKSKCPSSNKHCPSADNAYYSDQLYIHPICFSKASERSMYKENTPDKYDNGKDSKNTEKASTTLVVMVIILGILFLVSFMLNLYFCRKKIKEMDNCLNEQNGSVPTDENT